MSDNDFMAVGIGLILLSLAAVHMYVDYRISDVEKLIVSECRSMEEAK